MVVPICTKVKIDEEINKKYILSIQSVDSELKPGWEGNSQRGVRGVSCIRSVFK